MGKKERELEFAVSLEPAALKREQMAVLRFILALLEQATRLVRDLVEGG